MQTEWQTVLTLIRLLLLEQSHLSLHWLLKSNCPNTSDHYGISVISKYWLLHRSALTELNFFNSLQTHLEKQKMSTKPFLFWFTCTGTSLNFVAVNMSLLMRKPVYAICKKQSCRSACASWPSLIRAFVIRCLDTILPLLAIAEISRP